MVHSLFTALSIALLGLSLTIAPIAPLPSIEEQPVEYAFNEQINFHAVFHSDQPVGMALIFFQGQNEAQTIVERATFKKQGSSRYDIRYTHLIKRHPFQAFTTIEYHYEIMLQSGETYRSPSFRFLYSDNRFTWHSLQEGPFIVYWFEGDYSFAQGILDVAQEGLAEINRILPLVDPEILHIYIYSDTALMKEAINPSGETWIAGHAYPDLQTMLLYLPPGADHVLDMRQRVPHEIMHILLSQYLGTGYRNLPFWLVEGLASVVELYPNPDYPILLENALANNNLLAMATLCEGFPRDASGALLAYAQSASFVNYLYDRYGTSGFQRLLAEYANGVSCQHGVQSALGASLAQLERHWRSEVLLRGPDRSALMRILPWLAILLLVFIAPAGIIFASLQKQKRGKNSLHPGESKAKAKSNQISIN